MSQIPESVSANNIPEPWRSVIAALQAERDALQREIAFRDFEQARVSDIALNYGPYVEIQKALSTEITMHAAWRKRAEEAETREIALRKALELYEATAANEMKYSPEFQHCSEVARAALCMPIPVNAPICSTCGKIFLSCQCQKIHLER